MTREEALKKEGQELGKKDPQPELLKFLKDNNISYEDYRNYVGRAHKTRFEPRLQKVARDMYHRFRRF